MSEEKESRGVLSLLRKNITYTYTKPFRDVGKSSANIKASLARLQEIAHRDERQNNVPIVYQDLKKEAPEARVRRAEDSWVRISSGLKFSKALKLIGLLIGAYGMVLLGLSLYSYFVLSGLKIIGYWDVLTGALVYGLGYIWHRTYREEIVRTKHYIRQHGDDTIDISQREMLDMRKSFVRSKKILIGALFVIFLGTAYSFVSGGLNVILGFNGLAAMAFVCAMLFRYSLWAYQIKVERLVSAKDYFAEAGWSDMFWVKD